MRAGYYKHYLKYYWLGVACVAFIIAVGLFIRPSNEEVGLMQLQDHHYAEAVKTYEELKRSGDVSMNVIIPLVSIHEQEGDMENAVAVMAMYVKDHPKSLEARKRLTVLYQDSDMMDEYIQSLEVEETMDPSVNLLHELAFRYNFKGDYAHEAGALARLIARKDYTPHQEDYLELANYYAIEHRNGEALDALMALLKVKGFFIDDETMDLLIDLLLQRGRTFEAMELAIADASGQKNSRMISHFSSLFAKRQQPLFTLALLDTAAHLPDENNEFLEDRIYTAMIVQKQAAVFHEMERRYRANVLPESLMASFADMAIKRKDAGILRTILPRVMDDEDWSDEERRTLADALLDAGFKSEAEAMLLSFAGNAPLSSPDVQKLLYIWQGHPSPRGEAWLKSRIKHSQGLEQEKWQACLEDTDPRKSVTDQLIDSKGVRAKSIEGYNKALNSSDSVALTQMIKQHALKSSGTEQMKWLSYLEESGQRNAIIDVMERAPGSSQASTDVYVEALISNGDRGKLASVLSQKLKESQTPAFTKKITLIALGENLNAVALEGFKAVLANDPNDPDALRFLAFDAYSRGHVTGEVETMLGHYLEVSTKPDIEVEYTLGEILWRKKHYDQSLAYYAKALNEIEALSLPTFEARVMEAHIYYRQKQTDKALQLFRVLLSERPNDKGLRVEFANILMQANRYEEAEQLMKE